MGLPRGPASGAAAANPAAAGLSKTVEGSVPARCQVDKIKR
jgi:hypothetical protein